MSKQQADKLYEEYGRPLEPEHRGEYVAISAEGKTILGPTVRGVLERAKAELGPGSVIFKVGEKAVGRWR